MSDSMKSYHMIKFDSTSQAMPMMLMTAAHVAVIVIMIVARDWMKKAGFTLGQVDIEIDEDLPNFFKAVSLS